MRRFLIIQTAFTGDVVLATAIAEKLHGFYPDAQIDFLLRKGNEDLLKGHPFIKNVLVWDKKSGKYRDLLRIAKCIRQEKYTHIINPHRFATSGFLTLLSGAGYRSGFDKNPLSFGFTLKVEHVFSAVGDPRPVHEVDRYQQLIADITDDKSAMPALYPSVADYDVARQYQARQYICIAPASVWFTKQFPVAKWIELIDRLPAGFTVHIIGAPSDTGLAQEIIGKTTNGQVNDLCGKLSFLQSAALMKAAAMNYTNDSAPLHFATAMNAPVTAVFCSTVPAFGFGPLRENARTVEIKEQLYCRPCGLHGYKACPEGHFRCAFEITNEQLLWWTLKTT